MSGRSLLTIPATVEADIVACREGLSFWGGVDPETGRVIDAHHELNGICLAGKIVLMPTSRGSCSGSGVLLQLALNGQAPKALIFRENEEVLTLGAVIASHMFDKAIGVARISAADNPRLQRASHDAGYWSGGHHHAPHASLPSSRHPLPPPDGRSGHRWVSQ